MEENTNKDTRKSSVSIRVVGICTIAVAVALSFFAFALAGYIADTETNASTSEKRYVECSAAINNLRSASDYLTTQARLFVTTGRKECLDNYVREYTVSNRRGKAVEVLRLNLANDLDAVGELEKALNASNDLAEREFAAMRLAADYYGVGDLPDSVKTVGEGVLESTPEGDARLEVAKDLVLNEDYDVAKKNIISRVEASSEALLQQLDAELEESKSTMQALLFQLRISVALLLCIVMVFVLALFMYILDRKSVV